MGKLARKTRITWGLAGSEDGLKTTYPGPEVLRVEELYFCLSELQGSCHTVLISVKAVIDVIVLKF